MINKIRYNLISVLMLFTIRWSGDWKYDKEKGHKVWIERSWAQNLEAYFHWLMWQYMLKNHGDQNFGANMILNDELINRHYYNKNRLLFKILV